MSRLSPHHEQVNENGVGKCSVPMWRMGLPAGFCDKPAYGNRLPTKIRTFWDGRTIADDGRYAGYVPALACPGHGGPDSRVFMDGNAYCAVYPDFINLQESLAGFGATPEEARAALAKERRAA